MITKHKSKPTQLEMITKLAESLKKYFDAKYPCDTDDSCGDDMDENDRVKYKLHDTLIALHRILTAANCDTVDEVVKLLTRQPLSDEEIKQKLSVIISSSNSGNEKLESILELFNHHPNEWVRVEDVRNKLGPVANLIGIIKHEEIFSHSDNEINNIALLEVEKIESYINELKEI